MCCVSPPDLSALSVCDPKLVFNLLLCAALNHEFIKKTRI